MWKRSVITISLFFRLSLFVAPLTNQIDSPLSSISSSSSNNTTTATATSHPDKFKCSPNHIFKPNLYKKKPSTANKNTNTTLYYYKTTHEGEYPNKVYGLFLCVFGVSLGSCRNCLRDAIVIIKQHCQGAEEAILWYDQCLVRYSYRPFFSTLETVPNRCTTAASNADLYVGEPANFTKILYQTFLEMIQMATFDAFNKHAIKASNISGSNIIPPNSPSGHDNDVDRRLSRLTPAEAPTPTSLSAHDYDQDRRLIPGGSTPISPSAHDDDEVRRLIRGGAPPPPPNSPSGHDNDVDGRLSRLTTAEAPPTPTSPSAHDDDEYGRLGRFTPAEAPPTPTSPSVHDDDGQLIRVGAPPTPTSLSAHHYGQHRRLIPGGALPSPSTPISPSAHDDDEVRRLIQVGAKPTSHNAIIFLAIGIFIQLLLLITAYLLCRRRKVIPGNCQEFSFATVCKATQNFSIENQLGLGGFGSVYKGTLASGKRIAVKRLDPKSGQGRSEFRNEVDLIPGLRHKNIVQLLGYCEDEKTKQMMIIYEFIPKKSLDAHLFDSTNRPFVPLDWITRKNIAMGIARGLAYLHEDSPLKIIHRDIKSSNVLLDDKMNPKISDFGMARLLEDNQSEANTTTIVGTYGYRAPEYCMGGVISSKLDVYSFGVVLLEIISGLKCLNHMDRSFSLPSYTWELWCKGSAIELMDKAMAQSSVNSDEVLRWIRIGLFCVQEDAGKRPYMSDVRRMLENRNIELLEPTSPPLSVGQPDLEASQQSSSIYLDVEAGPCQS